jgi:hypothetical protein
MNNGADFTLALLDECPTDPMSDALHALTAALKAESPLQRSHPSGWGVTP